MTRRTFNLVIVMTLFCALSGTIGCGANPESVILSGNIALDGEPLEQGQIVFEPQGAGKMSVAQINRGRYELPARFGLPSGDYVVRITSERPTGETIQPAVYSEDKTPVKVYEQFLPEKYNTSSELRVSISTEMETTRDFSLTTK